MHTRLIHRFLQCLFVAFCLAVTLLATDLRAADDLRAMVNALGGGSFQESRKQVEALARTGDPKIVPALEALSEGDLYRRSTDGVVFIVRPAGSNFKLVDALTGDEAGEEARAAFEKVKVNNGLRRTIRVALGGLTLMSPDAGVRLQAAGTILRAPSADALEGLDAALAAETDGTVKAVLEQARAASVLVSDRPVDEKQAAVATLVQTGGRDSLSVLSAALSSADARLRPDIETGIRQIEDQLVLWAAGQNVWYGLSLGSVLLLAAIGLAITFGVMGIINMAHGEMVMLGAYTTFVVQQVIRTSYPGLFDWSLAIALPLAFLVTGAVGLVMERGLIRFLYGRPLETLLATWGVSLILQQAVRSIFGPTNQEVGNPSWMSGAFDVGGMTITWNRLWIIVFSLAVFAFLLFLLKKTPMGLQMRAVTQNRRMASSMGIRTPWVDALTFALGSGIAGIAGVALSQIDNVSPNLGQGYIIDSFMVVVFGGVGNLWGTLVGAFTLGILNKFLEPYAGAVLGKILVLVLIILFIQKRPRGLFALKGRAVEA
ncbi:urea ABC transporter permease subunit UrtB (plasmid) [Shinella sp. PSBB067]|uniref:urea ABC transporter permease subunit UrtB n=1 Tax=Shinella sp. PSBB067 TaxID=2715959 RepID=UPI00193B840E|nr:urea ABC transporter permease subunit UrtB [Shinella sp. PSBB067]QRI66155.1 urea ABC transporter permease subunit UrtB [Shinella sp. PSBB067]